MTSAGCRGAGPRDAWPPAVAVAGTHPGGWMRASIAPGRARTVHLAVLGCGELAERHVRAIRRTDPGVRIGFASQDVARAARFARRHGGFEAWGSYEAALADRRVEAVLVATAKAIHLPLAMQALASGRDVIVERPAFRSTDDADAVAAAASAVGRQILVSESHCYSPLAGMLRAIVASGELGDVLFVDLNALGRVVRHAWASPGSLAGGALFQDGVPWIDLMAHLGLTIESVQGFRPGTLDGVERSMLVVLQYEEGGVGTLRNSSEAPTFLGVQLSHIVGTAGVVTFDARGIFVVVRGRRSRLLVPGLRDRDGSRAMFEDFLAALRTGRVPRMTLARIRADLALLEAAVRSAP